MLSIAIYSNCFSNTELLKSKMQDFFLESKIIVKVMTFNDATKFITVPVSFDIYFLDIDTEVDVLKLGKEMMNIDHSSYFVFFSRDISKAYDCFKIRADYFLRNPIDPEDLHDILKDIRNKIKKDAIIIKSNYGDRRIFVNELNYINITKRSLCYHIVGNAIIEGQTLRGSFEKEIYPLQENPVLLFLSPSLLINVSNIKKLNDDNLEFEDNTILYFPKKAYNTISDKWKKYNEI